mgnify:CR=1 FL=1
MKNVILPVLALLACTSVACGSSQPAAVAPATPVAVNEADWTPPGEEQMTLPDAPQAQARKEAKASALRPTVFSEGKKGALVVLPTKRAN